MPLQPEPYSWQQFDQTMANAMLLDVSMEFHRLAQCYSSPAARIGKEKPGRSKTGVQEPKAIDCFLPAVMKRLCQNEVVLEEIILVRSRGLVSAGRFSSLWRPTLATNQRRWQKEYPS